MPRTPRIENEDSAYHVMTRGNWRKAIVFFDAHRELFAETLTGACSLTKFKTSAWNRLRKSTLLPVCFTKQPQIPR